MTSGLLRRGALCLALACGLASAQQFPFQLLVSNGTNAITAANGSTLPFVALVGQSQTLQVRATYVGTGRVNITQAQQIFGSTAFSASVTGTLPITLTPGDVLAFSITYKPTSAALATASFGIPFVETISTTTPPTNVQNTILFGLQGAAPAFQLNYVLTADQNVLPLPDGGAIIFPPTPINTTATANLLISNIGSGPGQITGITTPPATSSFRVAGLPSFPFTLNASSTLQLQVIYKPTQAVSDTGQVQIKLDSGTTLTANLQGSGTAPSLAYELLQGDAPVAVTPPGPIAFPDTNVGETNSVIVRVRNTGNGTATVNTPGVSGAAYSLTDLPLFPQILKTGDSFTFSINFTPAQAAALKGNLVVSSDLFSLTGQGLGAKLTFSYTTPAGTKVLGSGDAVVFGQIPIGQNQQVSFTVANTGTLPAPIANIGVAESNSPFKVSGISRPLPTSLGAGESVQFTITFTPTTPGFTNGTLRVDNNGIPLTGSGDALPTLPAYTIQAPSGTVAPQTQATVRLRLASAFPVALTGTLVITSSGNVVSDPAVQFSTGRSVAFSIPANSLDANFAGQGTQVFIQTGTVAASYTLTPTFLTLVGGVDVTPASPTTVQFTVPSAAPTLLSIQATNETANSFLLVLSGYSTTRSLAAVNVRFNPAPGFTLTSPQVSVDIRALAATWFSSTSSQSFGGQFAVLIPFTFSGTAPVGETLLQSIASVSVTISNDAGTSPAIQVSLP